MKTGRGRQRKRIVPAFSINQDKLRPHPLPHTFHSPELSHWPTKTAKARMEVFDFLAAALESVAEEILPQMNFIVHHINPRTVAAFARSSPASRK